MKTINIIGAGRVGKSLAYLFFHQGIYKPESIVCYSFKNAEMAVNFVGAGKAIASINKVKSADITLISVADDKIAEIAKQLASVGKLRSNDLVFHCSGALTSAVLREVLPSEVHVASVHPALSFSEAKTSFLNCYCTFEGDKPATEELMQAFLKIGATPIFLQEKQKIVYHTAMVLVSNCLIGLLQVGLAELNSIGIEEKVGLKLIEPLVQQCIADLFAKGPVAALTGPVSRGDWQLVEKEIQQLEHSHQLHRIVYQLLGKVCLELVPTEQQKKLEYAMTKQVLSKNLN